MSRIFHPLLYILFSATRQELIRQVHYLKIENQILRNRLPKRVLVTPTERRQLVKAARGLEKGIVQTSLHTAASNRSRRTAATWAESSATNGSEAC
jgi:putative transposase